jgi:adenine-specific DNA methylase
MSKRLIETAFPLAQASAASLHEKNMRHGHISTLHLWPARRPLGASRAAIVAALLPDPSDDEERKAMVRRLGGELITKPKATKGGKTEKDTVTGKGGILWWGTEAGPDLTWFRERIKAAYGGRAPRVLDPFAGGGAIPLEAMRLGCEVVANDLNPVAWFILKCTLDYPQSLGGERRPLPDFVLRDRGFMESFLKTHGLKGARLAAAVSRAAGEDDGKPLLIDDANRPWARADLGWHVRVWGQWVLAEARRQLATRYPTYAEWRALHPSVDVEPRPLRLLEPDAAGQVDVAAFNVDIPAATLDDPRTPRWVAKPTVAYLWARTVRCKSCRATVPLLKTRWLCRKGGKRVRLTTEPNASRNGVIFNVESHVPVQGTTVGARKAADKRLAEGTMSRKGVWCPCCGRPNTIQMTLEDIRFEGQAKRLGAVMTAVVVDGLNGKEYRRPTEHEIAIAEVSEADLDRAFVGVPFGMPIEPTPKGGGGAARAFSVGGYGLTRWADLFTKRQLLTLAVFTGAVRRVKAAATAVGYPEAWGEALWAYLALAIDRQADYGSALCSWTLLRETIRGTFGRFALPIVWDYAEVSPVSGSSGDYGGAVEWIGKATIFASKATRFSTSGVHRGSALTVQGEFDAVVTDPPYYDAIPYADLMDFFYVWLRRSLFGLSPEIDQAFESPLGPKWNHNTNDGELIDDSSRFGGDRAASKKNFEDGMAAVFLRCHAALVADGVFVIVFANKNPDAWETLVGAVIRAGFVVDGSLPIRTERGARNRSLNSAALSSSVWLVCRKRPSTARPGYDRPVLAAMRANITEQMRHFWDAGIRGPDFLWAATGPALEAYSKHPIVLREATSSGAREAMPVAEFLREVRRLVVEFAVGRVLRAEGGDVAAGLDDVTTYYLLHRESFGMTDAPVGAAILYALSCGLSDSDLTDRWEILARGKGSAAVEPEGNDEDEECDDEDEDEDEADEGRAGGSSTVRLRPWNARKRKALGLEGIGGKSVPMIDRLHRLMTLWKEGEVAKVDAFLSEAALTRDPLFPQIVQAVIELARRDGKPDEAVIIESISRHMQSRSGLAAARQPVLI